ncbi:hypothetical protein KJ992_01065 [Patescibacteria group bacterium]|nr:hypothetical protein [Patescibacteria group bacterium]MBU1160692.1 hypothetical protein [Patescibacteria group bacterium]MBU1778234.1 hypothetical protein [Patescibacteria group bacterium]
MNIKENVVPCCYELSYDLMANAPKIILRIHESIIKYCAILKSEPIVKEFMNDFGFQTFNINFNSKHLGFDGALENNGTSKDFAELSVLLPLVKKNTDENCHWCNGTGEDQCDDSIECMSCNGSCKEHVYDYDLAYKISASLTVLFDLLNSLTLQSTSFFPQLLTVQTMTIKNAHGGSLNGQFSYILVQWLQCNDHKIIAICEAVKNAYEYMYGSKYQYPGDNFRLRVDKTGWFIMDCPGGRCGIYPTQNTMFKLSQNSGYDFTSHNVDNPMQQLSILAGLAALHDQVRATYYAIK